MYVLHDWCVFKRLRYHDFFNFALQWELCEHSLFLFWSGDWLMCTNFDIWARISPQWLSDSWYDSWSVTFTGLRKTGAVYSGWASDKHILGTAQHCSQLSSNDAHYEQRSPESLPWTTFSAVQIMFARCSPLNSSHSHPLWFYTFVVLVTDELRRNFHAGH